MRSLWPFFSCKDLGFGLCYNFASGGSESESVFEGESEIILCLNEKSVKSREEKSSFDVKWGFPDNTGLSLGAFDKFFLQSCLVRRFIKCSE